MPRSLILLLRRRLFWLTLLLTVWLLCSGEAQAGPVADRLASFPDWNQKPTLAAARGDLVYPDWLRGDWQLTSTLVDLVAPLAPELVTPGFEGNRDRLGQPITCPVRFVSTVSRPRRLIPARLGLPQTVADRAFNGLSLARAYLGDGVVQSVRVDANNPNRQLTLLSGNRQLESTVTARAVETAADRFITVERFQQVFRGGAIPFFNEVETTTAYGRLGDRRVADQVTAVYLSPQDPDFPKAQNRPVALYRYQLELAPVDLTSARPPEGQPLS
ncbi:DUF6816 family protein [Leptolyngbya sp. KIOST-1]|uniref:DUF6816 family protein n=1 Tax=Leptolyngbya sp. KIOST-1 TaxID=1229172 RepID=UPI00068F3475|nr:hypothetical protein [Leptolyngbya sp. KIOST-1]